MLATIRNFLRDRKGAAAAEYALLLAIVAAGVAIAAFNLGEAVDEAITNAETCVDNVGNAIENGGTPTGCGDAGGATP